MRKQWTKEELIAFEDHIGDLYMDNQLPFLFHLSGGNEEQLIEPANYLNYGTIELFTDWLDRGLKEYKK